MHSQHQFLYQNVLIRYRDVGGGQPLLLLHGFGETAAIWDLQIEALSKAFRVIAPDLPGSGTSVAGSEAGHIIHLACSLNRMADACSALMQHISHQPFVVLGHSMGGYVALCMAAQAGHQLCGLGLINSTAFADTAAKKESRQKGAAFMLENGAYPFLRTAIPSLFGKAFTSNESDRIEALIEDARPFDGRYTAAYYQAMMARKDQTTLLEGIAIPVLFVIGDEDVAAPMADVLKQVQLPQIAHVIILNGVGHMSMWEATEALNKALLKFGKDCV